ncbi:MAG TPA: iron ABC transporter permease [Gemmatimonadales bacterium]
MTGRLFGLAAIALVSLVVGLHLGATLLGPDDLLRAIAEPASTEGTILLNLRAPRVLLAFGVGAGLGLTGAVLQALVRNPLADPYLLGLSGGAGLGAVLAIAFFTANPWALPVAAWAGALIAVALVYRLAVVAGRRLDPRILLLAGVVVSAFTGAIMSAILTLVPAPQLRNAFLWLLGGFSGSSWQALGIYAAYAAVPAGLLLLRARELDLLALGEEPAQYLGADVERTKRVVYFAASLLTAAAVAVCGVIGFVGLVVPHAMRRVVGPLHGRLLPAVILTSGSFLVLADGLARWVVQPLELPVGVVTATIGVPLFALMLRRSLR